jgi:hypothetical protein
MHTKNLQVPSGNIIKTFILKNWFPSIYFQESISSSSMHNKRKGKKEHKTLLFLEPLIFNFHF